MRVLWISILVVLLDQASKAAVLRLMHRGESIPLVGDWLKLTFTENPGMAFGITVFPREATAIFSIIVTVLVLWYLYSVRSGYTPYLVSLALILGGAVGNIIDRAFYGVLLGYGDFFMGKVVDFIHVDVWRGYLPEVLPFVGGAYLPLFPIWNVADMAIVVGVVGILVFQRRFHRKAFEDPVRERERLRALERERDEAVASQDPQTRTERSQTAGSDLPPTAPSAEQTGVTAEVSTEGLADETDHDSSAASTEETGSFDTSPEAGTEEGQTEKPEEDRSSYAPPGHS